MKLRKRVLFKKKMLETFDFQAFFIDFYI